ncbi:helix-turn-helix domain-containing protein [Pseudonocardia sp. RS11V-5]|uniref:PucR family transcriptional regulator n=1 Tax=Pseudonocardia terrae TaxID=2905831 RepID=UPI001E5DE0A4|nr:helix-turn-helix domain-containing protein [Pseudonocardia terrae]MCE3552876.1 helix-turn-helix domain-containing protein [Pseudonocardia terrae]
MTDAPSDLVRRVAYELLPLTVNIAEEITEHVLRVVPELAPGRSADEVHLVQESNEQNCGAVLSTLAFGVTATTIEPPAATRRLLHDLAANGGTLAHLLRGYRVGQEGLWRIWSAHAHERVPSAELYEVLRVSSAHLYEFVDRACQMIVEEYEALAEPSGSAPGAGRDELIRALLGSGPVDLAALSQALGHPLTDVHVALFAAPLSAAATTRRQLQHVVTAAGVPALVLPGAAGTWWGWLSWPAQPSSDVLNGLAALPVADVVVGMGEPAAGHDGFRRSHAQARTAHQVATMGLAPRAGVVRHREVEIAAVLCSDPERARRLAIDRLGPLAAQDETAARLRATLRALLRHGHNRAAAAKALTVHHKTVTYRVTQAEELLGRSLAWDTFDLEVALAIEEALGGL